MPIITASILGVLCWDDKGSFISCDIVPYNYGDVYPQISGAAAQSYDLMMADSMAVAAVETPICSWDFANM